MHEARNWSRTVRTLDFIITDPEIVGHKMGDAVTQVVKCGFPE